MGGFTLNTLHVWLRVGYISSWNFQVFEIQHVSVTANSQIHCSPHLNFFVNKARYKEFILVLLELLLD